MDVYDLLPKIHEWLAEILGENYVGTYFHGSLRLGSYNPAKSDLDFIIVVNEAPTQVVKRAVFDKLFENIQLFPPKGFEFSMVLARYCREIQHPVPYEMHGTANRALETKCIDGDDFKTDGDLASHFNVINVANPGLDFGRPSAEVFAKVPREYAIGSNYADACECAENICDNPTYCVLNLCRFCALVRDGLTLSKYDGGKWALENLETEYADVIEAAMREYGGDDGSSVAEFDEARLRGFAEEMKELMKGIIT